MLLDLTADEMVHDWAVSHSTHYIVPLSVGTAAAADDAVQAAAVLWLRIPHIGLDVCFALSVVKCRKNLSSALPKLQQQLFPESLSCKHQQPLPGTQKATREIPRGVSDFPPVSFAVLGQASL